jgi:hypothetical protein
MSSTTPYSVRWRGPTVIPHGRAWDVSVAVEHAGASPTISAATFTLYDQSGAKVVDAQVATVSGGTVTYTLAGPELTADDLGPRWLVKFEVTIGSTTIPFYNDAVIALAPLYPPVGTTDLTNRYSKLADLQSAGSSDLQAFITDAWGELVERMYEDATPFWKMRSPASLRPWLLNRALSYALYDLALLLNDDSHYSAEAKRLEGALERLYLSIKARLDTSEETTITDPVERASPVLLLTSSRSRRRWPR